MNEDSKKRDFIFRTPKPGHRELQKSHGGEPYNAEEHEELLGEIAERKLDEKFQSTITAIRKKEVRDHGAMYFVIEMDGEAPESLKDKLLKKLEATVHDYIDEYHSKALISIPTKLASRYTSRNLPLEVKEPLHNIRELKYEEQFSKSLARNERWIQSEKSIIIHIMPNTDEATAIKYLEGILQYLKQNNKEIIAETNTKLHLLVAVMQRTEADDLLKKANTVYKFEPVPIATAASIIGKKPRLKGRPASTSAGIVGRLPVTGLPWVCVPDTGANPIPQICSVLERDKDIYFKDTDDSDPKGHGTPIAHLVAFGENGTSPRARVISYKIYSPEIDDMVFNGMVSALEKYSQNCKLFSSSITFDATDNDSLLCYSKLGKMIQEKNVCFVSPVGNIYDELIDRKRYPRMLANYPIDFPAQNPQVIAVSSIAKRVKPGFSIAPVNCLSPFTKAGRTLTDTFDSIKPDLVEHGGNICDDLDSTGIGVCSFLKDGTPCDDFRGSSFAAPLAAGKLAEILGKYGNRAQNAETLKALLLMSCDRKGLDGYGYGFPSTFLEVNEDQALFIYEGIIRLPDRSQEKIEIEYFDTVSVPVPAGTQTIDMCLVHSDNYMLSKPSLNTYLHVKAWKSGRPSSPIHPDNRDEQSKKTNVKFYRWTFGTKSMQATWDFQITPSPTQYIDITNSKKTFVRYGCVILLSSQTRRFRPLTDDVWAEMNRWK